MKEYLTCGSCCEIVNKDDCEDVTIRGRRELGVPMEPDEEYTKCPECGDVHDDWYDADFKFVQKWLARNTTYGQLIEILSEDRD